MWGGIGFPPTINIGIYIYEIFKKPSGVVFQVKPNHDLNSLKERFVECDVNGNEIKKEAKPKKEKKKVGK